MKCRKRKHRDYEAAQRHLQRAREGRTGGHIEARVYYCRRCVAWHLTSAPAI